ncbi:MAG: HAD family phosphatase [Candidatus Micrarchaeota archaeon]
MTKAVLFDFDGVIVDSEPLHMKTFLELLAPYGVEVGTERWYREFAGTGSRHIFEVLVKEHGIQEDVDGLVARRKALYESRVRAGALKEMPGVRDFLRLLRERGIKAAIVSGSHRTNVQAALEMLSLGQFDLIVSGDDLKERKPEPGPFLFAAKRLGLKPGECLVIEDSISGCVAARRAGMRLVWMKPPVGLAQQEADLVVSDFRDKGLLGLL